MKYVYSFHEGNEQMMELLGWKGARLSELTNLNIPVPQGFIITTDACRLYHSNGKSMTEELENEILSYLENLEKISGKRLGDPENSLFLSVRPSQRIEMPNVSKTVLNVGINDSIAASISRKKESERFSLELQVNFLISYFNSILSREQVLDLEAINHDIISAYNGPNENGYDEFAKEELERFILKSKILYKRISGEKFPDNPRVHLIEAIKKMFNSWYSYRAIVHRQLNGLKDNQNMAVIVQIMTFGNSGPNSAVGYQYTRDPKTGEDNAFVKAYINSQKGGAPFFNEIYYHIDDSSKLSEKCLGQLADIGKRIEKHYKSVQLIYFIIEKDVPYVLMSRSARTCVETEAELNFAVDFVKEGIISKVGAVSRITKSQFSELSLPVFDREMLNNAEEIASGLPASKGVAYGKVYFTKEKVREHLSLEEKVIFVTEWLRADEEGIDIIQSVDGMVANGGMTSDQAIVSREKGTPCVALGYNHLSKDRTGTSCVVNGVTLYEGDLISIDGSSGKVYRGIIKIIPREREGNYGTFIEWVNEVEARNRDI